MDNIVDKQRNRLRKKELVIIGLMAAVLAVNLTRERQKADALKTYPAVLSQEEFEAALQGEPEVYLVEEAPYTASGPAGDPFGILSGEYAALVYNGEVYEDGIFLFDEDSILPIPGGWQQADESRKAAASSIFVYGVPLADLARCGLFPQKEVSLEETCMEEARESMDDGYYYPEGRGNRDNNRRYTLKGAGMKGTLTFVSTLGNGQVAPQVLNGEPAALVFDGGAESLAEALSQKEAGDISTMLLCGGVGEFLLAGLLAASIGRRKNSTGRSRSRPGS